MHWNKNSSHTEKMWSFIYPEKARFLISWFLTGQRANFRLP